MYTTLSAREINGKHDQKPNLHPKEKLPIVGVEL